MKRLFLLILSLALLGAANLKIGTPKLTFHAPLTDSYLDGTVPTDVSGNHAPVVAVTGAPTYSSAGANFNGSADSIEFATSNICAGDEVTIALRFTPDFAWNTGGNHAFYDFEGCRHYIYYLTSGDVLRIALGTTIIEGVSLSPFSASWLQNQENTLIISSADSTNTTNAWLNSTQILTNDLTSYARGTCTGVNVGGNVTPGLFFDGEIRDLMVTNTIWTAAERAEYISNAQGLRDNMKAADPGGASDLKAGY